MKNDKKHEFAGVDPIPSSSADVPDEPNCRLVVLGPDTSRRSRTDSSKAQQSAQEILEHRGNSPRIYRNMLVFLAADTERLEELGQAVRLWLAWTSIHQEEEQLNLDAAQKRQVTNNVKKYDETIEARLSETYCHLLVPSQEGTAPMEWIFTRLQGGDGLVNRASIRLIRDEELIINWSPATLRIELDRWLWKEEDYLSVKQLWEFLASYLYLPRLRDEQVLINAVTDGVNSITWKDYFAYSSAVREDGRYVGLMVAGIPNVTLDSSSVIVKPEVAQRQLDEDLKKKEEVEKEENGDTDKPPEDEEESKPQEVVLRRFHGGVELSPLRLGTDAGRIADEVISHLEGLIGSEVNVMVEINVEVPNGFPVPFGSHHPDCSSANYLWTRSRGTIGGHDQGFRHDHFL
ncbi:MAG: hypothetical protein JJE12_09875 [Anaerolineales bacterium]|nr:hypothetical protein [Anaerolineales bacterium]